MAAVVGKHCRTTAGVILGLGPGTHDAAVAIGEIKFLLHQQASRLAPKLDDPGVLGTSPRMTFGGMLASQLRQRR